MQRRDPITADTGFDAGSVSKQFTATAVLLLQQDGKLSVDDRLSRHVDGLPAWSDQVTLAQLMHHVSGIPETEDILLNKGFQPQDRVKRATLRKAITDVERLDFQPGERWAYNNPNYFLLAEVVERRSGQPLGGYLKTRIFEPLHLKMSVGYDSPVPGKATSLQVQQSQPAAGRRLALGRLRFRRPSDDPDPAGGVGRQLPQRHGGRTDVQRNQLAGAVSTTLGQSHPSDSEVYGAGIFRLTDGSLFRRVPREDG